MARSRRFAASVSPSRRAVARNAGYCANPRDVHEVIGLVDLTPQLRRKVKDLSGGQKRRLDLAMGMIGNPRLLFLDEPTTGFDPNARRGAWEMVENLRSSGTTILLNTHHMDEAQALADRVAVIAAGQIVAAGRPATIGGRDTAQARIRFGLPPGQAGGTCHSRQWPTAMGCSRCTPTSRPCCCTGSPAGHLTTTSARVS